MEKNKKKKKNRKSQKMLNKDLANKMMLKLN